MKRQLRKSLRNFIKFSLSLWKIIEITGKFAGKILSKLKEVRKIKLKGIEKTVTFK